MVDATLTRLVLAPPEGIDPDVVMDELAERIAEWVAAPVETTKGRRAAPRRGSGPRSRRA